MGISVEFSVDDIEAEILGDHKDVCERTALDFYEKVIELTPVRTGRLRASWKIHHTTPDLTIDPDLEKTRVGHYANKDSGESQDRESAIEQHEFDPPEIPAHLEGLPDAPVIYVTNVQPYAEYVNDGSPTNEPVHMVERALQAIGE